MPGVDSRLKCRGQVIAATKTVDLRSDREGTAAIGPSRIAIADALMYADGKPIVEITNMSLRMTGLSENRWRKLWSEPACSHAAARESAWTLRDLASQDQSVQPSLRAGRG